jgi:hypothetical protein
MENFMNICTANPDDYDSPWKELLEEYFREFAEFFFPDMAEGADWEKGYEFLDKELQQAVRDAELGKRLADKLVKVRRKDGEEVWVLVHVEIQGQYESGFAERMYVYNYRIFDRYHKPVASFAVLTDERPKWRPDHYGYELWGFGISVKFPVAKLSDWRGRQPEPEKSGNPFAMAVAAHLKTQETRHDPEERKKWKLHLIKQLYEQGRERKYIINLFRFIDWLMRLPEAAEKAFREEIFRYEEEKKMRYITSVERIGRAEGLQQGLQQGVQQGLQQGLQQGMRKGLLEAVEMGLSLKFGAEGEKLLPAIRLIEDSERLERIKNAVKTAENLAEVKALLD